MGKKIVAHITGIFEPIINVITAVSILKGVIMLLANFAGLSTESGLYRVFYACSDGFFYFLPFFLAYTASKQWKTDFFTTMLIPVAMLYPDMVTVIEGGEVALEFLGIPMMPAVYHSSVLPVLFATFLLIYVEKGCDRILPNVIKGFMKPILCCIVVLPVTFLVFGPIGMIIGNALTKVFSVMYSLNPVIAGAFMGFIIQPMVCVGAHWSIVPICINNIATKGYDMILPLLGAAVYAQSAAALMVGIGYFKRLKKMEDVEASETIAPEMRASLREKLVTKKRVAYQAAMAAALGVTEPALFGVNLPLLRPLITACIGGAVGGAMVGAAGAHCTSFAFPSFLTSIVYVGPGFGTFLISMVVGFVVTMLLMIPQLRQIVRLDKETGIES